MAKHESRRRRRAEWERIVESFRASGLSSGAYAARHGLTPATLKWWAAAFRRAPTRGGAETASPGFSELRVLGRGASAARATRAPGARGQSSSAASEPRIEVAAPGGRVVRVFGRVDRAALATVLEVVESC